MSNMTGSGKGVIMALRSEITKVNFTKSSMV